MLGALFFSLGLGEPESDFGALVPSAAASAAVPVIAADNPLPATSLRNTPAAPVAVPPDGAATTPDPAAVTAAGVGPAEPAAGTAATPDPAAVPAAGVRPAEPAAGAAATPDPAAVPAAGVGPAEPAASKTAGSIDASQQMGAATVHPELGYATFAEELAHSNMIRTIDTCIVSSFEECATVMHAQVTESDMLLPSNAHVLFFGSEALQQLVDVIVAIHRRQGELKEHVVMDKQLLSKFDHSNCELLTDRKTRGDTPATRASAVSLLEVGSDDASKSQRIYHSDFDVAATKVVNRVCNVVTNNTMCDSHARGSYERYIFSNGARLTAIINYRPLQSLSDSGTLARLRHELQYKGITNAFFMPPPSNAAFDEQCKKELDVNYEPNLADGSISRYTCADERNISEAEMDRYLKCAQELPHFSALAGLNIPRLLLVPAMYDPGNRTHDRFKHFLGVSPRKYDCSADHPVLEPGIGFANTTHHTEHECVVVCEEKNPVPGQRARCHAGSAMVMAAELAGSTRSILQRFPPGKLRRLRRRVALNAEPSAPAQRNRAAAKRQRLQKRARKIEANARIEARRLRKEARKAR